MSDSANHFEAFLASDHDAPPEVREFLQSPPDDWNNAVVATLVARTWEPLPDTISGEYRAYIMDNRLLFLAMLRRIKGETNGRTKETA